MEEVNYQRVRERFYSCTRDTIAITFEEYAAVAMRATEFLEFQITDRDSILFDELESALKDCVSKCGSISEVMLDIIASNDSAPTIGDLMRIRHIVRGLVSEDTIIRGSYGSKGAGNINLGVFIIA